MSDSKNFFHMNVTPVKTGSTAERLKYNHRSGKYAKKGDLLAAGAENMPEGMDPKVFFDTLDGHERRNGGAIDTKVALPRVLKPDQQAALARKLALMLAGESPVAWGDLNFGAESRVSSRGLTRIRSNLLEPTRTIP